MMKTLSHLFLALAALFLCSCATVTTLRVDAISAPQAQQGRIYCIVPANPDTSPKDLRFIEAARFVENALSERGYTRVEGSAGADVILALDAAIGKPENITRTSPQPVYAEEGGYYRVARVRVTDKNGRASYVRTTVWSPPYSRLIGTVDSSYTETIYEKRLALTAFANTDAPAEDLPQLWSVVVLARDSGGDLRAVLPAMAVAAARYAESDTGGQVELRLKADEPEVLRVSGRTGPAQ